MPLMTILISVLLSWGGRLLAGLGIGFLSFTVVLPALSSFVQSYFSDLPPEIFQMVGILRVDQCLTLLFSAAAARIATKVIAAPLSRIRS